MPILAFFTGKISRAEYDVIRKEVDRENLHPDGAVFHAASFDEAGMAHVADVWESAEALNAFAEKSLMPAFAKHRMTPPSVAVYPVHRAIAYPAVEKYRV